jgi:hypothetical protein
VTAATLSLRTLFGGLLLLVALGTLPLSGDETPSKSRKAAAGNATADKGVADKPTPQVMTPEREAAAMHFARAHHPELADLVERLRSEMKVEYERAIRQLYLTSERLARTKERSEDEYELQLAQWKIDSRIKLLAARMTISDDVKLEKQMEKLLHERLAARRVQLERELQRSQTRVKRVEESLRKLDDEERSIAQELARYRKTPANKTPVKQTAPTGTKPPAKSKPATKPQTNSETSPQTERTKTQN